MLLRVMSESCDVVTDEDDEDEYKTNFDVLEARLRMLDNIITRHMKQPVKRWPKAVNEALTSSSRDTWDSHSNTAYACNAMPWVSC